MKRQSTHNANFVQFHELAAGSFIIILHIDTDHGKQHRESSKVKEREESSQCGITACYMRH